MRAARLTVLSIWCVLAGIAGAEQITSTYRITAVDVARRKVTLFRKTTAGEREGTARVAEDTVIKINGERLIVGKLAVPAEGVVVYDPEDETGGQPSIILDRRQTRGEASFEK